MQASLQSRPDSLAVAPPQSFGLPLPLPLAPDTEQLLPALSAEGLISRESAERARVLIREAGLTPLPALLRLNAVAELPLYRFVAARLGIALVGDTASVDAVQLSHAGETGAEVLDLSAAWLAMKGVLVYQEGGAWIAAFKEPPPEEVRAVLLRKATAVAGGFQWRLLLPSLHEQVLRSARPDESRTLVGNDDLRALRELAEEGPTIELVNTVLSQAVTRRASDLHFEPEEF